MKKISITVFALFIIITTGCNNNLKTTLQIQNESSKDLDKITFQGVLFAAKENADIIGSWTGEGPIPGYFDATVTLNLDVSKDTWTALISASDHSQYLGRSSNGKWTRNGNALIFSGGAKGQIQLNSGTLIDNTFSVSGYVNERLFTFQLTSGNLQTSLTPGNRVVREIEAGSGYIHLKLNFVSYRTTTILTVAENENAEFTFSDNTLVTRSDGTGAPVTLGSL